MIKIIFNLHGMLKTYESSPTYKLIPSAKYGSNSPLVKMTLLTPGVLPPKRSFKFCTAPWSCT